MGETKPKLKMVYFITLVIQYTEIVPVKGTNLPQKRTGINVWSSIVKKARNANEAMDLTVQAANKTYPMMRLIGKAATELTEDIFIDDVELVPTLEDNSGEEKGGNES